jgi:hypothetical protein
VVVSQRAVLPQVSLSSTVVVAVDGVCCTRSDPALAVEPNLRRGQRRVARDVAETVGLSTAATEIMRTAITLHHSPGVTLSDGPVAYLMSAGAALDVLGLRAWQLPPRS